MRKALPIILFLSIAAACLSGCRDAETRRTLHKMMGSTIVLPEKVTCVQNGEVFPMPEELRSRPKLIVFVDSTECSKCRIDNFIRYELLFELSRTTGSFEVLLLLSVRNSEYQNILDHLVLSSPPYPVCIDSESSFRRDNPAIPDNSSMHSFSLDSDNRVILVGDPIYNESIMDLFRKLFNLYFFMIMEKKHILIALAAIMLVVGSVLTVRAIRKVNTTSIIFEKNLNALVDDEGSSFSFCYNEYDFSLIHRIMRCGDCEYVWGKGDNYGGICY